MRLTSRLSRCKISVTTIPVSAKGSASAIILRNSALQERVTNSENRSKPKCPPGSNPVSPHGLGIAFPNATAVVSQNALPTLRTDEQFQGLFHDLPFCFQAVNFFALRTRLSLMSILVLIK